MSTHTMNPNEYVFVSYSSKQANYALRVYSFLEEKGIPCWVAPRNIDPGQNYASQIVQAIRNCAALILIASDATNSSGHVSNEVGLAFDNKKVIIPFKIENLTFSDEYLYFLSRKHWIDAYHNLDAGLDMLLSTLRGIIGKKCIAPVSELKILNQSVDNEAFGSMPVVQEGKTDIKVLTRQDIVEILIRKIEKFSYSLAKLWRNPQDRQRFEQHAERMYTHSLNIYRYGNLFNFEESPITWMVRCANESKENDGIIVCGLPGSSKNMLLQLAFFHMLDQFISGESHLLPCYISMNYFEKIEYNQSDTATQMEERIRKELSEVLNYLEKNPEIELIIFVDSVREHIISRIMPENILSEILRPLKNYRRVVSIDTGWIKNKSQIKKVIPITGNRTGWVFQTKPVSMSNEAAALDFIDHILEMYQYVDFSSQEVYNALKSLKQLRLDIFLVRLIVQELRTSALSLSSLSAAEIYEKMALKELVGDENDLFRVSEAMFKYVTGGQRTEQQGDYTGKQWSLAHKHDTYVSFLIAYYYSCQIIRPEEGQNSDFLKTTLSSVEAAFFAQMLKENYYFQERLFQYVTEKYDELDIRQKSNGAYWLGHITYKNLTSAVIDFLLKRFAELKPEIKECREKNQSNYDNHFLFRAISYGLLLQGQMPAMDDYLSIVITNDVANAINRGATIEYYGDGHQMLRGDSYNLDVDNATGEQAIAALCHKVENSILKRDGKVVKNNLVTLLTILQTKIQGFVGKGLPELKGYVERTIRCIEAYQMQPKRISSKKIEFYIASVLDDLRLYLEVGRFDIAQITYHRFQKIKEIRCPQWEKFGMDRVESMSEHMFNSWLMAMLCLPEDAAYPEYNKREILDMLLIHDLAEADLPAEKDSRGDGRFEKQNQTLGKFFVKGTYPNLANMTHYYNVWSGFYKATNINAKIAHDISIIQQTYTFCEYSIRCSGCLLQDDVASWMNNQAKLGTEIGISIWNRLIDNNTAFQPLFLGKIIEEPVLNDRANQDTRTLTPAYTVDDSLQTVSRIQLSERNISMEMVKKEIASIAGMVLGELSDPSIACAFSLMEEMPENWRILVDKNNRIVAYWVFIALKNDYYEKALAGELYEGDIDLRAVEFTDLPGTYKGYLLISGVRPQDRTPANVQLMYHTLAEHLAELGKLEIFFDEFCAVAASAAGFSYFKRMGMHKVSEHRFGGEVYQIDLKDLDSVRLFGKNENLLKVYSDHVWEHE